MSDTEHEPDVHTEVTFAGDEPDEPHVQHLQHVPEPDKPHVPHLQHVQHAPEPDFSEMLLFLDEPVAAIVEKKTLLQKVFTPRSKSVKATTEVTFAEDESADFSQFSQAWRIAHIPCFQKVFTPRSKSVKATTPVICPKGDRKGNVRGLTVHGDELFIVRSKPEGHIEVYSASTFTFKHNIKVKELEGSWCLGLTACDSNNCLYVSYLRVGDWRIARMELTGDNEVLEWKVKVKERVLYNYLSVGLSVNSEHNLIVACGGGRMSNKLIEYTTRGELVHEIRLQDDIKSPHHAIQLNSCQYLVSHGDEDDLLHRVCVVDAVGRVLLSYGNKPGSKSGRLNWPQHLAVDRNGFIFVADCNNNRIVELDSELEWSRDLQRGGDDDVKQPCSLYLDEQRNLLFVGEINGEASRVVKVTL